MVDNQPVTNDQNEVGKIELTSEELIEKLKNALGRDGDFPASAKIVSELKQLTSDPNTTANQITEIILKEPSLGTRVLHLVNSSFYHRGTPIMTVSQAVLRIGMKPLADLCAGLVLLQKFVPASRRDGAFAGCLRKMVLTSLLSSAISTEASKAQGANKASECGYLAGALAEIGTLLLAYYFPQVYEAALKRAETKHQDIDKSILEITGLTPLKLSREVLDALNLPDFYKDVLSASDGDSPAPTAKNISPQQLEVQKGARGLRAAKEVSTVVAEGRSKEEIDRAVNNIQAKLGIDASVIKNVVVALPEMFKAHCELIEVDLPKLPDFVAEYKATDSSAEVVQDDGANDPFKQFVEEIRQAVENREPTASIITTVMETLAWSLKFDRVILLLVTGQNKNNLSGRMMLGKSEGIDPKKVIRPLGAQAQPKACDALAFKDSRPVYHGLSVLPDGWPFVAMPIGSGSRAIGVVYADKVHSTQTELTTREQAAISVLVELLDRSVNIHQ